MLVAKGWKRRMRLLPGSLGWSSGFEVEEEEEEEEEDEGEGDDDDFGDGEERRDR